MASPPAELISTEEFSDAATFLQAMSPCDERWSSDDSTSRWLFRGCGDARYQLIPRAWRSGPASGLETLRAILKPRVDEFLDVFERRRQEQLGEKQRDFLLQIAVETETVYRFVQLADELGYPVPDQHMVRSLKPVLQAHPPIGPPAILNLSPPLHTTEFFACTPFGIAQHHGIPTRLLDFTRRSRIAAFFAAWDAHCHLSQDQPRDRDNPKQLCVWAIDTYTCCVETSAYINWLRNRSPDSDLPEAIQRRVRDSRRRLVALLQIPRTAQSFVHAQDGLFAYVPYATEFFMEQGHWPSIDEALSWLSFAPASLPIRSLLLPVSEVPHLLDLLARERITLAHLMPRHENIVAVLESSWRRHLERTKPPSAEVPSRI